MMEQTNGLGLVHLYWGEGKGKTTAAMGLALRALGSGCKVTVVQFLKGADTGEVPLLRRLGAEVYRGKAGQKFVFQMDEEEKAATRALQTRNLQAALARPADLFGAGRSLCRLGAGHGGPRSAGTGGAQPSAVAWRWC